MNSSDFRKEAREKLRGKMGKAACIMLVFLGYSILLSLFTEIATAFELAAIVINVPIGLGLIIAYVKLFNGENVGAFDFFKLGFDKFGKAWGVSWFTFVKLLIPEIIAIIGYIIIMIGVVKTFAYKMIYLYGNVTTGTAKGILFYLIIGGSMIFIGVVWAYVKSYYYKLASIIISYNPEMTGKAAVNKSKELMEGKRWKLFCLELSFIGWYALAILTLGIGVIWLAPYVQFAEISFYNNLIQNQDNIEVI